LLTQIINKLIKDYYFKRRTAMSCPMYTDYTRGCITQIEVRPDASFDFCASERYIECPFYRTINHIGSICENIKKCPMYMHFQIGTFEDFLNITKLYCLSEKRDQCVRYKLKKAGKEVPKDLLPDGKKIKSS
jgi:hypothetical protein